ncbi:hypothetical protein I317_04115 [Kwoniella heveanensis CBS 569]|nr:hypothetical protein I317_04115 [Kwoniella heveanensis CBS 569]
MSACVMSNTLQVTATSTLTSTSTPEHKPFIEFQDTNFDSNLSDDIFDSSFSFMDPDSSNMEYYIASPDGRRSPVPDHSEASHNAEDHTRSRDERVGGAEVNPDNSNHFSLSPLTMQDPHIVFGQGHPSVEASPMPYSSYPPYALTYDHMHTTSNNGVHASPAHSSFFHPYRSSATGDFARNPRSPPRSPALSSSPHGSVNSNRLSFGAYTSVSPSLVSPHSVAGGQLSDTSPSHPYMYQLPLTYGTPLTSTSNLSNISPSGPGLSMVAGFPCPTQPQSQQESPFAKGRAPARPKPSRANTRKVKQEEDEDSDIEEDNIDHSRGGGLGLDKEERVPVSSKREDVRKARIESEQRRRDELREGFRRLKDALPVTNQRSSKVSLLDRAVAHIQSIEAANRYLLAELEKSNTECTKLRE